MKDNSITSESSNGKRSKKYMLFLVFYMILYESFDTYTCSYYFNIGYYVQMDFGINNSIWLFMLSIASIGYFFSIIIHFLADKVGRKPMMIVVFLGMGISSFLLGFARNPISFTIFLFFMYIFFTSDIWGIIMSEEAPKDKRAGYSSIILVMGMGFSISIVIIRMFLIYPDPANPGRQTWENMAFFGGLAIPLALLGFFMKETPAFKKIRQDKAASTKFSKENVINTIKKPFEGNNRMVVITFILIGFILGLFFANAHSLEAVLSLQFGEDNYNIAMMIGGLGSVGAFGLTGLISDKIGRKNTVYLYCIILFTSTLISSIFIEISLFWGIAIISFFTNGFFWGLGSITRLFALESFDTDIRAYASGWRSFSYALGLTIGLAISGVLAMFIPLHVIYVIMAIGLIVGIPILTKRYLPETKGKDLMIEHLD